MPNFEYQPPESGSDVTDIDQLSAYSAVWDVLNKSLNKRGYPAKPNEEAFSFYHMAGADLERQGFSDEEATLIVDTCYDDWLKFNTEQVL